MQYSPYYHEILKKCIATFGNIFNNISISKLDQSNVEVERIKVPLSYGPKQKYLIITQSESDFNKGYSITFPRISFEIKALAYDPLRKVSHLKKIIKAKDEDNKNVDMVFEAVPYKLTVELNIIAKNITNANQILEQILPLFTPSYQVTINTIPSMDIKDDISISLAGINLEDSYEDDFVKRREIIYTLTFNMGINFYGAKRNQPLITKAHTDIYAATYADLSNQDELNKLPRVIRTTVTPDPEDANYNDDFGYTVETESFNDGKRYDPETGEDVVIEEDEEIDG